MNKKNILVLAEHDNHVLKEATHSAIAAGTLFAGELGGEAELTVLVVGYQCEGVAKSVANIAGVTKVLCCDDPLYEHGLSENVTHVLFSIASHYQIILAAATTFGKNVLPRLAALLDVAQISDITQIISEDTFVRPIYAGHVLATVQSSDPIKVITLRPTAFTLGSNPPPSSAAPIEALTPSPDLGLSKFVRADCPPSTRPELSVASIVISGGRGLQNRENFKLLEEIADILGAAIGASRAAVDAGFVPNDYQVGQTGKVVAPKLYIAVGISGAIQHVAGMKDSKVIVAINKDADAPIFQVADYGLVGDLFEILPELKKALTVKA